jgi:hypothetical protein
MQSRRANQSLALAVLLLLSPGSTLPAFAQQAVTAATLSGRIEDPNGAALSGATVTVTNVDKNQTSLCTSDDHGRYSFLYLPVGSYQLRVERSNSTGYHGADALGRPFDHAPLGCCRRGGDAEY